MTSDDRRHGRGAVGTRAVSPVGPVARAIRMLSPAVALCAVASVLHGGCLVTEHCYSNADCTDSKMCLQNGECG